MKASTIGAIAILGMTLAAGAAQAQEADSYLIQLDDTASNNDVVGNTYQNGNLIQSVTFTGDQIVSPYTLWNGATLTASFDNQFNYYDPNNGPLSDTIEISGVEGDNFITFNFLSGAALNGPLPNGGSYVENGQYQEGVFPGTVSNGDYYDIQFASADGVPEPAVWAVMLLGVGIVGTALRRRPAGLIRT